MIAIGLGRKTDAIPDADTALANRPEEPTLQHLGVPSNIAWRCGGRGDLTATQHYRFQPPRISSSNSSALIRVLTSAPSSRELAKSRFS